MTIWHVKLFFEGAEYSEDLAGLEVAKDWVQTTLARLGYTDSLEWKQVDDTWRAGFTPNLDAYVTPRT